MPFVDEGWILVPGRFAVPTEDDGAELAGLSCNGLPSKLSSPAPVIPPVAQRLPRRGRRGGSGVVVGVAEESASRAKHR
jgi:hypothetical protein